MVTCELDKEVSGELLGWKLPAWNALLLHKVVPSCGGLVVYLTLICFDITLIYEHFENGDRSVAVFCAILMILPAVLSLVFTLASPPPGLQTDNSAFMVTLQNNDLKWIGIQFLNLIFFPIAAIGRYCHQIFWWVEATFACHELDETRAREAIAHAHAPSPTELYLFLQAFIHCAPHIILNILDLMARVSTSSFDKFTVQIISVVASSLRMASTAAMYRRFEREKLCGKKYPWSTNCDDHNEKPTDYINNNIEDEPIYEDLVTNQPAVEARNSDKRGKHSSDLIDFTSRHVSYIHTRMSSRFYVDEISDSESGSDYLSPISPALTGTRKQSLLESDDEYVSPITITDKILRSRRDTNNALGSQYTIEKVHITPPPAMEAPRPGSLAQWAEKIVENAESIPLWLSAPPRSKHGIIIQDEPDIPRRVPRSFMRGLEPQDASAAFTNFLGWHMFFVARLFSIAAFINLFPVFAIIILFSHYQVILLFLIVPQASTVKRSFYLFLAFIYIFCLMEFKIRFRHVRVWHVFWFLLCTIQIVLFTGLWVSLDNALHDWWRFYITLLIFVSMFLSYMCFLLYYAVLKPKETIVYVNNKNNIK